jgi:uncharacterized protein YcaQ
MEEKKIIQLEIKGIDSETYYTTEQNLKKIDKLSEPEGIHILSPFDNLIIQRKRIKNLFDFDYVIECYLPSAKRKFGYFCMPVLLGNKFIGKIDAKANRETGVFQVINYFPEDGKKLLQDEKNLLKEKLNEFAEFTGCERVEWRNNV